MKFIDLLTIFLFISGFSLFILGIIIKSFLLSSVGLLMFIQFGLIFVIFTIDNLREVKK